MHPQIFGLSSWLLFVCLGILTALLLFRILFSHFKMSDDVFTKFALLLCGSIFLGLIFAWLFQGLYELPQLLRGEIDWILIHRKADGKLETGGMTFLGGAVGGTLAFFILVFISTNKNERKQVWNLICLAPICLTAGHCLGRIGCFLGGCCYGKHTDSFLGVDFPYVDTSPKEYVLRLPTQLFESIFLALLCVALLILVLKFKKYSLTVLVYMFSYSIFRFCLEFLRDDPRGAFFLISPSQWQCVIMFLGALALFAYMFKLKRVPFNGRQEKPFSYLNQEKA